MSCWMSSSRDHTIFTGPSTCLAICTAAPMKSTSSRRPNPPPSMWLCTTTFSGGSPVTLRGDGLRPPDHLSANPDIATVFAHIDGAIDRLHRGVGEEGKLVDGIKLLACARQGLGHVAAVKGDHAFHLGDFRHVGDDVRRSQLCVRASVPLDLERRQAFLGCAHMGGDDGNGIVEFYDLKHVLDGQCLAVVHALEACRRTRDRLRSVRELHARHHCIDAVDWPCR